MLQRKEDPEVENFIKQMENMKLEMDPIIKPENLEQETQQVYERLTPVKGPPVYPKNLSQVPKNNSQAPIITSPSMVNDRNTSGILSKCDLAEEDLRKSNFLFE